VRGELPLDQESCEAGSAVCAFPLDAASGGLDVGGWSAVGVGDGSVATGSAPVDDELVLLVELVSWEPPLVPAGVPLVVSVEPVGEPVVWLLSAGAVASGSSAHADGAAAATLASAIRPAQAKLLKVAANRPDVAAKEEPGPKDDNS
jgi:hypothetical protein